MFAKVFTSIFDSTINEQPLHIFKVWIALLAFAQEDGIVDMTARAIANRTELPVDQVEEALNVLSAPDPMSRCSEQDGRRIVPIPGRPYGWQIVTFKHYREMKRSEDRREYHRNYMREYRAAHNPTSAAASDESLRYVNTREQSLRKLTDTETETETSLLSERQRRRTTPKKSFDVNEAEYQLATLLFTSIQERNPGHREPDLQKWALHVDRMMRLDGRDPADIRRVIEWAQADDFWANNILSTEKLRTQFDQLLLKSGRANVHVDRARPEGPQGVAL